MSFDTKLTELANAINTKAGKAGKKTIGQLVEEVNDLKTIHETKDRLPTLVYDKTYVATYGNRTSSTTSWARYPSTSMTITSISGYKYVLFSISNIEELIIGNQTITETGSYIVGDTYGSRYQGSSGLSATYLVRNYIYAYFDSTNKILYFILNQPNQSTTTYRLIRTTTSVSPATGYLCKDVVIKTSGSPVVTTGAFGSITTSTSYYYYLEQNAVYPTLLNNTVYTIGNKRQVSLSNVDKTKTYTVISGFYFIASSYNTQPTANLISSTLEV